MARTEPLYYSEKLLLDGFIAVLNEEPGAIEKFNAICNMLDGAMDAIKAAAKLRKLQQE